MIKIVDTYAEIPSLFEDGKFQIEKWRIYAEKIYPALADIFESETENYTKNGDYTFEKDFLPIINAVCGSFEFEKLHEVFIEATENLNSRIKENFGRVLDADVVFWLGLGTSAGCAGEINGRNTVLLGAEKIIELDWCSKEQMCALVYHELGHIFHSQRGKMEQAAEENENSFVYQLFTEGIAMYFEQTVFGNAEFYHQDKNGWKAWCDEHFAEMLADFDCELSAMTRFSQRYFGDWCDYRGRGDVGYYLGTRFIYELLQNYSFDEIINFDIETVYGHYKSFAKKHIG